MLTIQRQFSLPNCILILEGINVDETSSSPRPLLSTLTRFECHFGNESQVIQGGRELLNLLAQKVHVQAQSLLSGIKSKPIQHEDSGLSLKAVGQGNFHLTITNNLLQSAETEENETKGLELKLNSVQLFDLVDAFDQLMEDTQTLPDLALKLSPISRKNAQSQGIAGQRLIPVSIGVASLALIAGISFVMPIPEITKPTAPEIEETTESVIKTKPSNDSSTTPEKGLDPEPSSTPKTQSEASSEPPSDFIEEQSEGTAE